MIWAGAFVLFFVGGPLLFRTLTRARASQRGLRRLAALAVIFASVGVLGGTLARGGLSGQLWVTLGSLLALWLAWVSVLAFVTQAVRRNDSSLRMKRLTGVLGALGTTVPWFGLASANMVWT